MCMYRNVCRPMCIRMDMYTHGRTQPKIAGEGGGQSEVQKDTLLLLIIWHKKKGTYSQKGHFFHDYPGGSCPLPPPPPLGTALVHVCMCVQVCTCMYRHLHVYMFFLSFRLYSRLCLIIQSPIQLELPNLKCLEHFFLETVPFY